MLKTSPVVLALLFRLFWHCMYIYGGYPFVSQFRDAFVHTVAARAVLSPLYLVRGAASQVHLCSKTCHPCHDSPRLPSHSDMEICS